MGIHCTFQLSSGDRPPDSAGGDADLTWRWLIGHLLIGEKLACWWWCCCLRCSLSPLQHPSLNFLLPARYIVSSVIYRLGLEKEIKGRTEHGVKQKTNKRSRALSRKEEIRNGAWITVWDTVKCLTITLFDTNKLKIYLLW
jgi:hypothetical protein